MNKFNILFLLFMLHEVASRNTGDIIRCCRVSTTGAGFRGALDRTETGKRCQLWSAQYPHAHNFTSARQFPDDSLEEASNYCRNPDRDDGGPWCYTTDPDTRRELCNVPMCPIYPECRLIDADASTLYLGTKRQTVSGKICKNWKDVDEHFTEDHNYCRNPDNKESGLWCWVSETEWESCYVPFCKPTAACISDALLGIEYVGTTSITEKGLECQRWDRQLPHSHKHTEKDFPDDGPLRDSHNYCRNPGGTRDRLWCYTMDPNIEWQYCDVPKCDGTKISQQGEGYAGNNRLTLSKKSCQRWDSQRPHPHNMTDPSRFPDKNLEFASDFCRNPDARLGGPWCYTTDSATEWEYCEIPFKKGAPIVQSKHVVHIGIDGLQQGCLADVPGGTPNIYNRLRDKGTWTMKGRTSLVTLSAPGWAAHLCGMNSESTGIVSNQWNPPWRDFYQPITPVTGNDVPLPCIFHTLKGQDNNIHTALFHSWPYLGNFGDYGTPGRMDYEFYDIHNKSDSNATDSNLAKAMEGYLKNIFRSAPKSYSYIYLRQADEAGHAHKWCSAPYLEAVKNCDNLVGMLLDVIYNLDIRDDVLVVVGTDHGGEGFGHGQQRDVDLVIPFFLRGPSVKINHEMSFTIEPTDIAPIAAYALGMKPNPWWTGKVPKEIFEI